MITGPRTSAPNLKVPGPCLSGDFFSPEFLGSPEMMSIRQKFFSRFFRSSRIPSKFYAVVLSYWDIVFCIG